MTQPDTNATKTGGVLTKFGARPWGFPLTDLTAQFFRKYRLDSLAIRHPKVSISSKVPVSKEVWE